MTTKEKIATHLKNQIAELEAKLAKLDEVPGLDQLELDASFFSSSNIDFDCLPHADVIKVIKAIGGDWEKTPGDNANVHYAREVAGLTLRCYNGEPPPNCKIVEVLETIPAQPERIVTRRKLVCQ